MPITITFEEQSRHVLAVARGEFDLTSAKSGFERCVERCVSAGLGKLLVDARGVSGEPTTQERIEFGSFVALTDWRLTHATPVRPLQIALVATPPVLDPHRLGQLVAMSAGCWAKAMDSMTEAERWLGIDPLSRPVWRRLVRTN